MKFFYLLLTLLFGSNSFAGGTTLADINKLTQEMENKYAIKFKVDSMPKTGCLNEMKILLSTCLNSGVQLCQK